MGPFEFKDQCLTPQLKSSWPPHVIEVKYKYCMVFHKMAIDAPGHCPHGGVQCLEYSLMIAHWVPFRI